MAPYVRPQGMEDTAELKIDVDREKASALGVSLADVNTALSANFGSDYVNNFVDGNRVQQVIDAAAARLRGQIRVPVLTSPASAVAELKKRHIKGRRDPA